MNDGLIVGGGSGLGSSVNGNLVQIDRLLWHREAGFREGGSGSTRIVVEKVFC
jgi:hypothetical protein